MIENINITDYKCFKDFETDGFKRVNLIGGKNNVGKTAFMEALFLTSSDNIFNIYMNLLVVKSNRDAINSISSIKKDEDSIKDIVTKSQFNIEFNKNKKCFIQKDSDKYLFSCEEELSYMEILNKLIQFPFKYSFSREFITVFSDFNMMYEKTISDLKESRKLSVLNGYLKDIFNIEEIDYIHGVPKVYTTKWENLSDMGQGLKIFVNIVSSILCSSNKTIFIDEIETGIHYSNFDRLWKIILTISKEQNVQVFATTHSKECIESYSKVVQKLEDKEITFVELGRDKEKKLTSMVYPYEWFIDEIEQHQELRGW
jgi:AAA15 family ATPase/GTPase